MKLLLDEHYPNQIAVQLRKAGHDVVTVSESELRRTEDEALLQIAVAQRRVLVTNNVGDFQRIARDWLTLGQEHFGIILTSDRSMPRHLRYVGLHVRALGPILADNPADDAFLNQIRWLARPAG